MTQQAMMLHEEGCRHAEVDCAAKDDGAINLLSLSC